MKKHLVFAMLLTAAFASAAWAVKISDLTSLSSADDADELAIVDDSASATKKIAFSAVMDSIDALDNLASIQGQTVTLSGALTVESAAIIDQDLSSDATPGWAGAEFSGLTASKPVFTDGSKALTNSGTMPVDQGGTGQTSYTSGQLLIGNSTGNTLAKATLTEGSGIDITNGAGSIEIAAESADVSNAGVVELATDAETVTGTDSGRAVSPAGLTARLAAPGAIGGTTSAAGTFTTMASSAVNVSGLTASKPVFTDGSKNLTSSGTMPVDQGGTGQTSYSDGELLIGNSTGSTLTVATLTEDEAIDITNAAGSITIAAETASDINPGVVELATDAEAVDGTESTLAVTPSALTARLAAPGEIGGTAPAAASFTTISAAESVLIDVPSSPEAWDSAFAVMQIGGNASMFATASAGAGKQLILTQNGYYENAWKYQDSDEASYYVQTGGTHKFVVAPAGTADDTISEKVDAMLIDNDGSVTFGGDVAVEGDLVGTANLSAVSTTGAAMLATNAADDVVLFGGATDGEARELKITGYYSGDASRTLEIGVGVDAADSASFDGVGNYYFDGHVAMGGSGFDPDEDVVLDLYESGEHSLLRLTASSANIIFDNYVSGRYDWAIGHKHSTALYTGDFEFSSKDAGAAFDGEPAYGVDGGSYTSRLTIAGDSGGVRFKPLTHDFAADGDLPTAMPTVFLLDGDDDSDNDTLDLQSLDATEEAGLVVYLVAHANVDANDTVTINMGETQCTNCPTIIFDKVGESATLLWTGTTWVVLSLQNSL